MNNFEFVIKLWSYSSEAEQGLNDYIKECTDKGIKILEFDSFVTETIEGMTFTFIFKIYKRR